MARWSWRVGAAPKEMHLQMADHYQDRPFPTDADHDRGANPYVRGESEPLAELAQTDPFGTAAKTPLPLQSRANVLIDGTHGIIAGHGRVEAAKLAGMNDVPTVCV